MRITINGREINTSQADLSYRELVEFSGLPYDDYYTITYSGPRRGDYRRSGTVAFGEVIDLDDGMSFTVIRTGNG